MTMGGGGLVEVVSWAMGVSEVAPQNALSFACLVKFGDHLTGASLR